MSEGKINGNIYQAPHCDDKVLHAPGKCKYCDAFPTAQANRITDNINFTGEGDPNKKQCPAEVRRSAATIHRWYGNVPVPEGTVVPSMWGIPEEEPQATAVCTCLSGRSRFCDVHGGDDE
jgi:hypothetical protein